MIDGAAKATLRAAERIASLLADAGIRCAVIGAAALAAHGYPRSTQDLDLATGVDPARLAGVAEALRAEGFTVEVSMPDAADPLGGVLRVDRADTLRIEIVNFLNPPFGGSPALAEMVLRDAQPARDGSSLRVVTLPHLVMLKLYAGGRDDKRDVQELLRANPGTDLDELRALAKRFRKDRMLDAWLRELGAPDEA